MPNSLRSPMRIEIFDVLNLKSMQDVEALFHAPVYSTPMIGVWAKGELIQKGWGVRDAQRISRAFVYVTRRFDSKPCRGHFERYRDLSSIDD